MGMTNVKLQIKNLYDPEKIYTGDFLVDSGAHFTVLPENIWKKLGLKSDGERSFSLADGKIVTRKMSSAFVKYDDEQVAMPVVLGNKTDSPLLGVLVLEAMGLMLDPFQRKIYKSKLMLA